MIDKSKPEQTDNKECSNLLTTHFETNSKL